MHKSFYPSRNFSKNNLNNYHFKKTLRFHAHISPSENPPKTLKSENSAAVNSSFLFEFWLSFSFLFLFYL